MKNGELRFNSPSSERLHLNQRYLVLASLPNNSFSFLFFLPFSFPCPLNHDHRFCYVGYLMPIFRCSRHSHIEILALHILRFALRTILSSNAATLQYFAYESLTLSLTPAT